MSTADRRSPHHGLTASEAAEQAAAYSEPARLGLAPIDRHRSIAAEYAERTARALVGNDLMGALRAAQITMSALGAVEYELQFEQRSAAMRETWARKTGTTRRPARTLTSVTETTA